MFVRKATHDREMTLIRELLEIHTAMLEEHAKSLHTQSYTIGIHNEMLNQHFRPFDWAKDLDDVRSS